MRKRVDRQCSRCGTRLAWCFNVCSDCSSRLYFHTRYLSGGQLAQSAVAGARRRGELADPRTLACADCGGIATEYDHRDYGEPLKVEAVCRGCNARRGKAIPKQWVPGEWLAYLERQAKINWPGKRAVQRLHDRFSHELPDDIFGPAPAVAERVA